MRLEKMLATKLTDAEMDEINRYVEKHHDNPSQVDKEFSHQTLEIPLAVMNGDELSDKMIDLGLTWLTATLPMKSKLKYRARFYEFFRTVVKDESLLAGLE